MRETLEAEYVGVLGVKLTRPLSPDELVAQRQTVTKPAGKGMRDQPCHTLSSFICFALN